MPPPQQNTPNSKLMDYKIIMAGCLTLLFLIIFFTRSGDSYIPEKMLPGFWTVSDEFKEKANIDQMIIYFGKGDGYLYKGFLALVVDNDTVFNETINFRITPKGYFKCGYILEMEKKVQYMPQKLTMTLDPFEGLMEMKCIDDNKVYARLLKDNQMSAKTILKIDENESCVDEEEGGDEEDIKVIEDTTDDVENI